MVNAKLRLLGHMIKHVLHCLCPYFHEYDSIFKMVISITLFKQTHVFSSQMVMNRSWNFHLFLLWNVSRTYLQGRWSNKLDSGTTKTKIIAKKCHFNCNFWEILECPPSTYKDYVGYIYGFARQTQATLPFFGRSATDFFR